MSSLKLVPELYCTDINITKQFYVDVLGFKLCYERPAEQFAYFTLDGIDIMVEGLHGDGRRWLTGEMQLPFGRGINFQWDVRNIDAMYSRISALAPNAILLALETKTYQCGADVAVQQQFVVQDPDGYLFRFCCEA